MCLPLLLAFLSAGPMLLVQGRMISCSCTTEHCRKEGTSTCNTTGLCFSQYLDRQDGSDPLIKGCVASKTPLLCENRRPSVGLDRRWPVLICCDKHMCNAKLFPNVAKSTPPSPFVTSSSAPSSTTGATSATETASKSMSMDTVYLVLVGIGVCCFGVVTCLALFLSKRHSVFCDPEFGTVGSNGYMKGCPEPPTTVSRGLDNKVILHT